MNAALVDDSVVNETLVDDSYIDEALGYDSYVNDTFQLQTAPRPPCPWGR